MRPKGRGGRGGAFALLALLVAPALAGCTEDPAPTPGPLSLVEAYGPALADARRLDATASLVAFAGFEGPRPEHLTGLVATATPEGDGSRHAPRGDGRVDVWGILFVTREGSLLRSEVTAAPFGVETRAMSAPSDLPLPALWALNLGGRLVVDTPEAVAILSGGDASLGAALGDPASHVLYASALAPLDRGGALDLVHHIEVGYGQAGDAPFLRYGEVGHFSGELVAVGDARTHEEAHTVTLLDERFTLDPTHPEAVASAALAAPVAGVHAEMRVDGQGRFVLEIVRENETVVARFSGTALAAPQSSARSLGTLPVGDYALRAQATGLVTFDIRVTGVVVA